MSRLDDELRDAFRRHDPSPDFAARVIELAARQPESQNGWKTNGWKQTLIELLQPPKLRWVAIGVTASLLIAVAAGAYRNLHRVQHVGSVDTTAVIDEQPPKNTDSAASQPVTTAPSPRNNGAAGKSQTSQAAKAHRNHLAQSAAQRELRARAEAAKEKVLFALQIASATLKDAQRCINDDGYKSEP